MRLCCPKCCEGYHEDLGHCPRCGPVCSGRELETLTADRDLWRARCEAIVAMLEPNEHESECPHPSCDMKVTLHAAAVKIMKGEE